MYIAHCLEKLTIRGKMNCLDWWIRDGQADAVRSSTADERAFQKKNRMCQSTKA